MSENKELVDDLYKEMKAKENRKRVVGTISKEMSSESGGIAMVSVDLLFNDKEEADAYIESQQSDDGQIANLIIINPLF